MVGTRGGAIALLTIVVAAGLVPAPVAGDHVVANWVYGDPKGSFGLVEVVYKELDDANQGGPVRIYMGDDYVVCLNGPVGAAFAPATQSGYVAHEWRGCNPRDPVSTFTYRLERGDRGSPLRDMATVTFDYDYGSPGVFRVQWRAGNEDGLGQGQSYIVAL